MLIKSPTGYISEIESIRGLAIFSVVIFHIWGYLSSVYPSVTIPFLFLESILINGRQGVEVFFVISGFVMALPSLRGKQKNAKDFYWGRFYRLMPPYLIVLLVCFLGYLLKHSGDFLEYSKHFVASAFYLHDIFFNKPSIFNVVFWTLEVEVQFYLVVPLLALLYKSSPIVRISFFFAGIFVLLFVKQAYGDFNILLIGFLHYFFIGYLVAEFYFIVQLKQKIAVAFCSFLSALCLFIILVFNSRTSVSAEICYLLILFVFFLATLKGENYLLGFFTPLGKISYSVYLTHYPVISVLGGLIVYGNRFLAVPLNWYVLTGFLILMVICYFVGAFYYKAVETRFVKSTAK